MRKIKGEQAQLETGGPFLVVPEKFSDSESRKKSLKR